MNEGTPETDLSPELFSEKISQSGIVVLDIRTPEEIDTGFIVGARGLDFYSDIFESEIKSLDKNSFYALYCRSGHRSGIALKMMQDLGFQKVFHLKGGIIEWVEAGNSLTFK
jgi:hypothetical protein